MPKVYRPLTVYEREARERKRRTLARLASLSDLDRIIEAKVAIRPMQMVKSGKVISVKHAKLQARRELTTESHICREDRDLGVPRTVIARSPRREPIRPAGFPKRTLLDRVYEYNAKRAKA